MGVKASAKNKIRWQNTWFCHRIVKKVGRGTDPETRANAD